MKWLVQLHHETCVKLGITVVTFELEDEGLIEVYFTGSSLMFSVISASQKADSNRDVLIVSGVNKVYECSAINNIARQISFILIEHLEALKSFLCSCLLVISKTIRP